MAVCESTDFLFPMKANVFYPIVSQTTGYGIVSKQWVHDRTIAINLNPAGSANKEEVTPNVNITRESLLIGRVKTDIRISSDDTRYAMTNVIITNILDRNGNEVYMETSGPRSGKSTLFEIASFEPYMGPFGTVEYYNVLLRRSENQGSDV